MDKRFRLHPLQTKRNQTTLVQSIKVLIPSQMKETNPTTHKFIRKLQDHPFELKKRRASISKDRHADTKRFTSSSVRCNFAHHHVPLNSTCKKVFGQYLSKTTLFRDSHIVQQIATAPVSKNKIGLFPPLADHVENKSCISNGGEIPNTKCIACQRNLA